MDDAPLDGAPVEAGPEDGEAGSETIQIGEADQPERQYVDVEDPDNRYVRVKVQGEDIEVPYSEAIRGYSREADYTRKAQEVAQARQEAEFGMNLQRALQSNPEMTLRILSEQYGLNLGGQAPVPMVEEPDYTDPYERQLAEERAARLALEERINQRETDDRLNTAINGLRQQFNANDDDLREVINLAYQLGANVDQLPYLFKAMTFDKINARVQAQRLVEKQREEEAAQRQAAAASAAQVVQQGTIGSNGITARAPADGPMTIRQAVEAALAEHGL